MLKANHDLEAVGLNRKRKKNKKTLRQKKVMTSWVGLVTCMLNANHELEVVGLNKQRRGEKKGHDFQGLVL